MPLAITVKMKPHDEKRLDSEGFRGSDELREKVACFCRKHNIPYCDEFVSVVVHDEKEEPSACLHGYGDLEVRLKRSLIQEISVVCDGDFQTVASNGADKPADHERQGYAERFLDLTKLRPDQRESRLEEFIPQASGIYVEARIFRLITREDVEFIKDHSFWGSLRKRFNR